VATEDDLRELALSLPEASEREAWGMPTFRVRNKIFAVLNPVQGPGVKFARDERGALVAAEPDKFYTTAHDRNYDLMRLRLEGIDRDELRELLTDAWRMTAGPRLAARHGL
jgi:hypothetical protein